MTFSVEIEREKDGRWLAEVPASPGVLAYGKSEDEVIGARLRTLTGSHRPR